MARSARLLGIIALVAVIGFSMTACGGGGGDDTGSLTITGLGAYDGKYVIAMGGGDGEGDEVALFAGNSFNINHEKETITGTGTQINGGTVTLKVWEASEEEGDLIGYNGNDAVDVFFLILKNPTVNVIALSENLLDNTELKKLGVVALGVEENVKFKNGVATVSASGNVVGIDDW
jgi:hypothetical protein